MSYTATTSPHAGDAEPFMALLRAACADASVRDRLERLLAQPEERRSALVHALVTDLVVAGAPARLVEAIASLRDRQLAHRAQALLARDARGERWMRRAAGVVLAAVGGVFALACMAQLVNGLQTGLAGPPGWKDFLWAVLPLVLCTAAWALACRVAQLRLRRPRRRWLALGALAWAAAALSPLAYPAGNCTEGDQALVKNNPRRAAQAYTGCLDWRPFASEANARALRMRSLANERAQAHEAAADDLAASYRLSPATSHAEHMRLAKLQRRAGRLAEAVAALEQAVPLAIEDELARTLFSLGWSQWKLGRHEAAVASLTRVLELSPGNVPPLWVRGQAYEALGRRELARSDFQACAGNMTPEALAGPWLAQQLPALREKLAGYGIALP